MQRQSSAKPGVAMRTLFIACVYVCAIVFSLMAFITITKAEPIQAGMAVVDITPPQPARLAGSFRERLSTGLHDPLNAKGAGLAARRLSCGYCVLRSDRHYHGDFYKGSRSGGREDGYSQVEHCRRLHT